MSTPAQSSSGNIENSAVFESASGSPAANSSGSLKTEQLESQSPMLNSVSASEENNSGSPPRPDESNSSPPPLGQNSPSLQDSLSSEGQLVSPSNTAAPVEPTAAAPPPPPPPPAPQPPAVEAKKPYVPPPAIPPKTYQDTGIGVGQTAPEENEKKMASAAAQTNFQTPPRKTRKRSQKQLEADEMARAFREEVNPRYIEMFSNVPIKHRPKGFPAAAARQAVYMDENLRNDFVKNIAEERRNAIEIKLGTKTRKVHPATLKDIETILKMSERSLISKHPDKKFLIRMFGRETRKVARSYTSENINTLSTSRSSNRSRTPKSINNISNMLESSR